MKRISWDLYFMMMAKLAASRSGCNSRPTGAVIVKQKRVIATGYNGTIAGHSQCSDQGGDFCIRRAIGKDDTGDKKYIDCPSIHAEQNAINQIATHGGISIKGATLYCTLQPCIICLKNIVSVGIQRIVYELAYQSDDLERDRYWTTQINQYKIITKQIKFGLASNIEHMETIHKTLFDITSLRRL